MPQKGSDLAGIRALAEDAKEAVATHEAKCDERWEQNKATLAEMRNDIKSLIDVQPRVSDPWRDYWRAATAGLISLVLAAGGTMLWNVLVKQDQMGATVTEISIRGAQNRDDIVEIKSDLKDVKADQRDTNSKVQSAHEAINRLEAKTP